MAGSYFIAKLYRQHRSVVIVVPRPVLVALELNAGEHIVFVWQQSEGEFKIRKFIPEGAKDAADSGHTNKQDRGRAPQAKDGGRR